MDKFFRIPFAFSGDQTPIPDAADPGGAVSFEEGYTFDYQRQKTDPQYRSIERDKMNALFNAVTKAIAEIQGQGIPDFITTALNGGTAFSYAQNAIVRYSGVLYISLVAANTALPTDATKWALLPTAAAIQSEIFSAAVAGGTANAITANFAPAITALPAAPGTLHVLVRAASANTSSAVTFAANATAAKTIVKLGNTPLAASDISGAGHWLNLVFDATLDKWVLLNAAQGDLFIQSGAGATVRSQQNKLRDAVSVKDFGAPADGVSADDAAFSSAIASGARVIDARRLLLRINSQITIPSGVTLDLTGSKIYMPGTSGVRFSMVAVSKPNIVGPFEIFGDGSTVGTLLPIYISDSTSFRIISPNIENIPGTGIMRDGGTNTSGRADHGIIEAPKIKLCYQGYEDQSGTGAEYSIISNPNISQCTNFGLKTTAGNTLVIGGNIVDNNDGVIVASGSNSAHGGFYGVNINHNTQYNLHTIGVLNGETFEGCHFYANGGALGASSIFLENSKGISISGGHLDCQIYNYKDGSSGLNVIENMYCPGGYGVARLPGSNNGHDQLILRGCYGPGSYAIAGGNDPTGISINDPHGLCYIAAQRDPGATQSLTSGTAADLIWPSEPFPDRQNAYNTGTGVFTVPAGMAGEYEVQFDALFGGTAMNAPASFVEVKLNGSTKKLFLSSIFGTTKLSIQGSFRIYLAAGDTLRVNATITGTAPITFGDATWPSNFSVKRIA